MEQRSFNNYHLGGGGDDQVIGRLLFQSQSQTAVYLKTNKIITRNID